MLLALAFLPVCSSGVLRSRGRIPRRLLCSAAADPPSLLPRASWISSATNPRLKQIKRLHTRRQREKSGLILLEGHRLLLDALDAGHTAEFVLLSEEALQAPEGPRLARTLASTASAEQVAFAPAKLIAELSDTQTPQGVISLLSQPHAPLPPRASFVLVLDRMADPGNMGTVLRSAAGAGVDAVLLLPGCCDVWGLKALRAGMGAQLRLPTSAAASYEQVKDQLARWGCRIVAADSGATIDHSSVDWARPSALVVGSEAHGLAEEVRSDPEVTSCSIPLASGLESLNAAVAASIILYEAVRQRAPQGSSTLADR